jgi:hypothetical protein
MGDQGDGAVIEEDRSRVNDLDEPRGWLFWCSWVAGGALIGFGVWTAFDRAGAIHPVSFGAWFVGLTLVHDLVLAPAISAAAVVFLPRVPLRLRGIVFAAAIVSGALVVISLPPLLGDPADNASILPRNYVAGVAVAIAATWTVAAIGVLALRLRTRGRA